MHSCVVSNIFLHFRIIYYPFSHIMPPSSNLFSIIFTEIISNKNTVLHQHHGHTTKLKAKNLWR